VLHGTEDKIVMIEGTRKMYESISSKDKEFIEYKGFYHGIFVEPESNQVYEDIFKWLSKRIQ
jgi:alpha-beta hydrolase superfamily lysophospholipase